MHLNLLDMRSTNVIIAASPRLGPPPNPCMSHLWHGAQIPAVGGRAMRDGGSLLSSREEVGEAVEMWGNKVTSIWKPDRWKRPREWVGQEGGLRGRQSEIYQASGAPVSRPRRTRWAGSCGETAGPTLGAGGVQDHTCGWHALGTWQRGHTQKGGR